MLQLQLIREKAPEIVKALQKKHYAQAEENVRKILELDAARRAGQQELEAVQQEVNRISKEIGLLFQQGKREAAEAMKAQTALCKEKNKELSAKVSGLEAQIQALLYSIPNTPHESVPEGKDATGNVVEKQVGQIDHLPQGALPHWELASKYGIIDFELGNKVTGAGFPVYKGKGAKLQRALINFFLDRASKAGYVEIEPPLMINEASGYGTGQLPDKDAQMYHIGLDNYYMIPTAEVPVTNLYRDCILQEKDLPVKNCAYSACFRREAGSYGKDVRGLNRLHQFDKVEIVRIEKPENSYEVLEEMCRHVGGLLEELELTYRVVRLCGGDMSFTSALTFDFEVFSAAQERWLEVSSVSNFETYQANRLHLRYKAADGKTRLLHTLNGSALALPRVVAALLENHQDEKGIRIPAALQPFTGFARIGEEL